MEIKMKENWTVLKKRKLSLYAIDVQCGVQCFPESNDMEIEIGWFFFHVNFVTTLMVSLLLTILQTFNFNETNYYRTPILLFVRKQIFPQFNENRYKSNIA